MRKAVVVLGAGRSATSAVAKGLHLAGFDMGSPMLGANSSNPYGHYEHRPLITLNDRILAELGGAWDDPPTIDVTGANAWRFVDDAADYITSRGPDQFGMKDPRCVLLWPVWRAAFARFADIDLIQVRTHRNPHLSAASLVKRDGTAPDRALWITEQYHQRLERWTGEHIHA